MRQREPPQFRQSYGGVLDHFPDFSLDEIAWQKRYLAKQTKQTDLHTQYASRLPMNLPVEGESYAQNRTSFCWIFLDKEGNPVDRFQFDSSRSAVFSAAAPLAEIGNGSRVP